MPTGVQLTSMSAVIECRTPQSTALHLRRLARSSARSKVRLLTTTRAPRLTRPKAIARAAPLGQQTRTFQHNAVIAAATTKRGHSKLTGAQIRLLQTLAPDLPEASINLAIDATIGKWFGFEAPSWLSDPSWSKPGMILMGLWGAGGGMILWLAGLQGIPNQLYEAANIDGANVLRRFWHVTLPMLTPYIFFSLVMGVIGVPAETPGHAEDVGLVAHDQQGEGVPARHRRQAIPVEIASGGHQPREIRIRGLLAPGPPAFRILSTRPALQDLRFPAHRSLISPEGSVIPTAK